MGAYAATLRLGVERLESVLPRVRELPLGGTAVGTGINTPAAFAERAIAALAERTGQPFTEARNHFEAQGTRDSLVELSGVLRTIAVGLTKICNDLRWMSSGPTTGLAEIHLPDLQPGSSIMPGKVNPVLPEATLMVCARVVGNDATIAWAGASGSFELNVMMPVMAHALLESIHVLSTSTRAARRAVRRRDHRRRRADAPLRRVLPLGRHAAQRARRLRGGRQDRQAGAGRGRHDPRDRDRDGLRRARRPHRGAARRRPRRGLDDGPLMDPTREAFKAIDRAMTGDSRVLEVGCGSGEMAERINALPGVSLVATDYSDDSVELTAARGVDARHADICYLPFDGESFDVVYAGWMLDHVRDIDRALAEVRRVLRPGGTFVAVTDGDDGTARAASPPLLQRDRRADAVASLQRRTPPGPRDRRPATSPSSRHADEAVAGRPEPALAWPS